MMIPEQVAGPWKEYLNSKIKEVMEFNAFIKQVYAPLVCQRAMVLAAQNNKNLWITQKDGTLKPSLRIHYYDSHDVSPDSGIIVFQLHHYGTWDDETVYRLSLSFSSDALADPIEFQKDSDTILRKATQQHNDDIIKRLAESREARHKEYLRLKKEFEPDAVEDLID